MSENLTDEILISELRALASSTSMQLLAPVFLQAANRLERLSEANMQALASINRDLGIE